MFGTPTLRANGNFDVVYELVIENTGNVNLAGLTLVEDLATQYGTALVSAGNLTLITAPADASSSVNLDTTWDGFVTTEMVDQTAATALAVGDSYTIQFSVEVDPNAVGAPATLQNQVTAGGDAVDENGNPITDSTGNPIIVTDDSDNGTDPNSDNGSGTTDDPTPLLIADIGLAKEVGSAVVNGDNFDFEFTLYWQNTGTVALDDVTVLDDVAAEFGGQFAGVSGLTVQNFNGTGSAPTANTVGWNSDDTTTSLVNSTGTLNVGDSFEVVFTLTFDPSGAPSELTNQATSSGNGVDPNDNPLGIQVTDESDNGTDTSGENGTEETMDGTFGNDPTPVNLPPIAVDETVTTAFETPVIIDPIGNDFHLNGDVVTITEINGVPLTPGVPQTIAVPNATVTVAADGTITVTPDAEFSGDIGVLYTIVDEDGETDSAVHTVVVPNVPPIAVDETVTTQPDTPVVIDPLANDSDPNNDPLTITEVAGVVITPGIAQTIPVPNGVVTVSADGTITVTPDAGFEGDIDVPYTISDPDGATSSAVHTVEVPNAQPLAVDETVSTQPDTPVVIDPLANDSDPNNEPLTIIEVAGVVITPGIAQTIPVSNGVVTVAADGTITVTPDEGFDGNIDVPYTISDPDGETSSAIHTVEVPPEFGAAVNIDLLTIVPAVPRSAFVSDNSFLREPDEQETDIDLVILDAVEELSSLNSVNLVSLINLDVPLNVTEAANIDSIPNVEYVGSEGFSSGKGYRGTISVDPTDECGRFFIDTIIRDSMLSVITRSTIDPERSSGVVRFSATLANGDSLPDWISPIGDGEYLVDPSVGVESVALKLTAHRESGWGLDRYVEINITTGEITELAVPPSETQFSQPEAVAE